MIILYQFKFWINFNLNLIYYLKFVISSIELITFELINLVAVWIWLMSQF